MPDYKGPDPDDKENWKKAMDGPKSFGQEPIQFAHAEEWNELEPIKMPMNWPQAVASTVTVVAVAAVLIVLFMVLWGPW